jgi:hypothetical protein
MIKAGAWGEPKRIFSALATHFERFFLSPASPKPLAAFRIGVSAVLLLQAWLLRDYLLDYSSSQGIVQRSIADQLVDPSLPQLSALFEFASQWGWSENSVIVSTGLTYITSLLLLFLGFWTRGAAFCAWFLNWILNNTGFSGSYGVDTYAHVFLFYLIFLPSGAAYSLDKIFGRVSDEPSWQARLGIRTVQLHMCISYLTSGIEKSMSEHWWNGEVIWRALNLPTYSTYDFHWLIHVPFIPILLGWGTLVIEVFYCVGIWPRQTRWFWVTSICMLHLGIAIFLGLPVFGLMMCVPTLTMFGFPSKALGDYQRAANGRSPMGVTAALEI